MFRLVTLCSAAALVVAAIAPNVHAQPRGTALAVTMTNDPTSNEIRVYDAATGVLLQSLPTNGQGGAGGNAGGVKQYKGVLVAVVNNGSNTVALYKRQNDRLSFEKLLTTTSAPVSVDFGNDHLYVAGATTVDSFVLRGNSVEWRDGTTVLQLAGGGLPPGGSTAQVGVVDDRQLLVTLKADPDPGTVDVVTLRDGAVTAAAPAAVSAPTGALAPFGFSVYEDGTALITLAHSAQDGLFRNGAFTSVIDAGQVGPCWTTKVGKYVFIANTGSRTLSRLIATGSNVFIDSPAAAIITTGSPTDVDAAAGILGQIDHGAGQSHLSLFSYNEFGELAAAVPPITLGVPDANGIAIVPSSDPARQ